MNKPTIGGLCFSFEPLVEVLKLLVLLTDASLHVRVQLMQGVDTLVGIFVVAN
jgi:hypothetical protein